jgi:hypothetical protein
MNSDDQFLSPRIKGINCNKEGLLGSKTQTQRHCKESRRFYKNFIDSIFEWLIGSGL